MPSDTTHVGPIVFSHPVARGQLKEHGEVVTFRKSDRTTGETWWRESRTGEKQGDVHVQKITPADPRRDNLLEPHQPFSGFDSVREWQEAIAGMGGPGLPNEGYLYRVTEIPENDQ